MLIERYKYTPIDRTSVDGRRLYSTPDGLRVPSVTTILDATKPEEKRQALANWRRAVGEQKAQQITTEAANRGTRMHTYLEHYVLTSELKDRGSNPYTWPSHAMAETVISNGLQNVNEFWGVEIPLYFPQLYAGTSDGAGVHKGEPAILDYKQTNKPKKEEWIEDYYLQLCAYALAHNEVHGTNIRKGVILMCVKPDLDESFNITKPPEYQEFVLEGARFDLYSQLWWQRLEQYYTQS